MENAFPVLVDRALVDPAGGGLEQRAEPVAREAVHERFTLTLGPHRPRELVPLVVREESRVRDYHGGDGVRVIARPAQANATAGVVDHQYDLFEPDLLAEAFDRLDMPSPGPGRIGRRVAEAG